MSIPGAVRTTKKDSGGDDAATSAANSNTEAAYSHNTPSTSSTTMPTKGKSRYLEFPPVYLPSGGAAANPSSSGVGTDQGSTLLVRSRSSGSSTSTSSSLSSTFSDVTSMSLISSASSSSYTSHRDQELEHDRYRDLGRYGVSGINTDSERPRGTSSPYTKTNAFFGSPFSTRPPSPAPPALSITNHKSKTEDFFATSLPTFADPSELSADSTVNRSSTSVHPSRIFPSRYTSSLSTAAHTSATSPYLDSYATRSPENISAYNPLEEQSSSDLRFHRVSSGASISSTVSSASSLISKRLPTPPPPSTQPNSPIRPTRMLRREDTIVPDIPASSSMAPSSSFVDVREDEPTPRPADHEPTLLRFERSLLLAGDVQLLDIPLSSSPDGSRSQSRTPMDESLSFSDDDDDLEHSQEGHAAAEEEQPRPGTIITLPHSPSAPGLPLSPLYSVFPELSLESSLSTSTSGSTASWALYASPLSSATLSLSESGGSGRDRETPTPTNDHDHQQDVSPSPSSSALLQSPAQPQLRLLRPLGHGAFSFVWLAEDLSRIPLAMVSKLSVRDLRRRESKGKAARKGRRETLEPEQPQSTEPTSSEHSTPSPASTTTTSKSRVRDGLRKMLSFSRGPTAPPPPIPTASSESKRRLSRNSKSPPPDSSSSSTSTSHHHQNALSLSRDASLKKFTERVRGTRPARSVLLNSSGSSPRPSSQPREEGDSVSATDMDVEPASPLQPSLSRTTSLPVSQRKTSSVSNKRARTKDHPKPLDLDTAREGDSLRDKDGKDQDPSSSTDSAGRLVAVKMTPRRVKPAFSGAGYINMTGNKRKHTLEEKSLRKEEKRRHREEEERTRVGFVREVEVLRHISHPNITPLLAHLSTAAHHILVLPYLPGGDLLGLVNSDVAWGMLKESVLRRIWCELCKAVAWMHGVGLVHRDIKLENILLTTPTFSSLTPTSPPPTLSSLPAAPAPFIKLTDFGLSRFVEIDEHGEAELLSTRCGSEAYAAPELVTGGSGRHHGGSRGVSGAAGAGVAGVYDARKTDAWACGVVLYSLAGRQLPFGEGVGADTGLRGSRIGGERGVGVDSQVHGGRGNPAERRHWLMRIARGEWEWPGDLETEGDGDVVVNHDREWDEQDLIGPTLVKSQGARRMVTRLLVRNTRKRARIADLWDDPWMDMAKAFPGSTSTADSLSNRAEAKMDVDVESESLGTESSSNSLHWPFDPHTAHAPRNIDGLPHTFGQEAEADDDVEFYEHPSTLSPLSYDGQRYPNPYGEDNDSFEDSDSGEFNLERAIVGESGALNAEEEEEEEDEEGGFLFNQEGIDGITRQEVI